MLREENAVFSFNEDDIGDISNTDMKINLTDNVPVQLNYHVVPKPLYNE